MRVSQKLAEIGMPEVTKKLTLLPPHFLKERQITQHANVSRCKMMLFMKMIRAVLSAVLSGNGGAKVSFFCDLRQTCLSEFLRYSHAFWWKLKLNVCTLRIKSFLPLSTSFLPPLSLLSGSFLKISWKNVILLVAFSRAKVGVKN